jgi:hypothetical protein
VPNTREVGRTGADRPDSGRICTINPTYFDTRSGSVPGTDNFEREFTLSLVESEEDTLGRIEASLERIEDGTYGDCGECGAKIPKARLNAIPYAILCVKCASQSERG